MAKKRRASVWIRADHADEYLVAAAHYLARAATRPVATLLPPPSVSATLYCAFAAEAYVNVALIRLLGEDEYQPIARMPVRSKYFLAPRLGSREAWFTESEAVLESLGELFTTRNQLVHAQPERLYWAPAKEEDEAPTDVTAPRPELPDVARWLAATADAVCRLAESHAELSEMRRVAGPLLELQPMLMSFDPESDGPDLDRIVAALRESLIRHDREDFMDTEELDALMTEQQPDWDLEGLDSD